MSDPNLFAVLTPCDENAKQAFNLSENIHYYRKASQRIVEKPTISSRESTPASIPASHQPDNCILLYFDKLPKDPKTGWQFGTNPRTSDVLLGHRGSLGVSGCHFHITVTEQLRMELHDISKHGMIVTYNGQAIDVVVNRDKRLLFFEPETETPWGEIIIFQTRRGLHSRSRLLVTE